MVSRALRRSRPSRSSVSGSGAAGFSAAASFLAASAFALAALSSASFTRSYSALLRRKRSQAFCVKNIA